MRANEVSYVHPTGRLRRGPTGIWRDFAGLPVDPAHPESVAFISRYSWVGEASAEKRAVIGNFLATMAKCWERKDEAGISKPSADKKRREKAVEALASMPIQGSIIMLAKGGYALRTHDTYDFLAASAASMFQAGQPMRRCAVCNDWFGMSRSDAFLCGNVCRVRNSMEGRANG